MTKPLPPRRLSFERLEDRTTPTWGTPWFDGANLTLSFVPEGTNISGAPSDLFATLGANASQHDWQREILRAYQTWAVESNLNVGLVADGGAAMGTPGPAQGDIRFGDIRIGSRPSSGVDHHESDHMAGAVGFDYVSGTWAGDLVFNSRYQFGLGDVPNLHADLFSVALHEASHSFGLADDVTNKNSTLWAQYQGVYTGLYPGDVTAIQSLYGGPRRHDAFEGLDGNGSISLAYNLTANGNRIALAADITTASDVDTFQFTTPADSGITGLTIDLRAAGISLLTSRVTILDAQGSVLASAMATDPTGNNLSVQLPDYAASATYYVQVRGAESSAFSIGAYNLRLSYTPHDPDGANGAIASSHDSNTEAAANETLPTAAVLSPVQATRPSSFVVFGEVSAPTDADWYQITPDAPSAFTGTLFVNVVTPTDGLVATVSVYDAAGRALDAPVAMNEAGAYVVQLPGAATGATYHLKVAATYPDGSRATGHYTLGAALIPDAAPDFDHLTTTSLGAAANTYYGDMTVSGGRLTQFTLSADAGDSAALTAVRMTIYDDQGQSVFSTVAVAGGKMATGSVWLSGGTFTVVFHAATRDGSDIADLNIRLGARKVSDPMDVLLIDPTSPPPPPPAEQSQVSVMNPVTTPPAVPLVDPISNPFDGLLGLP